MLLKLKIDGKKNQVPAVTLDKGPTMTILSFSAAAASHNLKQSVTKSKDEFGTVISWIQIFFFLTASLELKAKGRDSFTYTLLLKREKRINADYETNMVCFYYNVVASVGARFSMANPSVFRAENPMASDLSSDRSVFRGGSSSSSSNRRRDLVFVVNPGGFYSVFSLSSFTFVCLLRKRVAVRALSLLCMMNWTQVLMGEPVKSGRKYFLISNLASVVIVMWVSLSFFD